MRRDLKLHVIGLMGRLGSEAFDFKKANALSSAAAVGGRLQRMVRFYFP